MTGVYFLFYRKKLVYIGATKSWPNRLIGHKMVKFDSAKILECPEDLRFEYEKRLIAIFNPKSNVRDTTRARVRKMNLDWVKANRELIAPFMRDMDNAKGSAKKIHKVRTSALPLLNRLKDELKYSPRTNPLDLFWSLKTAFQKLPSPPES